MPPHHLLNGLKGLASGSGACTQAALRELGTRFLPLTKNLGCVTVFCGQVAPQPVRAAQELLDM